MPIAYKDAALHALRSRFATTVDRYIQALVNPGGTIDDAVVRAMMEHIARLTTGPNSLHFPPAIHVSSVQAVQQSYAREVRVLALQLQREAANRLRELKMKSKQIPESTHTTFNTVFNAPVGTAYISSTHSEQSNSEITLENIQQIESFSQGHPELEDAARAIRNAYPQKASMLEQAQKWLSLLTSVGV